MLFSKSKGRILDELRVFLNIEHWNLFIKWIGKLEKVNKVT